MTMQDANDFLFAGGSKAFQFAEVNDICRGTIESAEVKQQTSIEGELLTWADGSPRKQLVITVQTTLRDSDDDDGLRTLYAKGGNYEVASGSGTSMRNAIADAVKAAGATQINVGDEIAVCYSGVGKIKQRGQSAPKLYECSYKVAQRAVSGKDLFGDE